MAREESTALIVVGLLLVLAHSCAAQDPHDPRTVGVGGGVLPSSYMNSYGSSSSGGYNRLYSPYSYGDPSSSYGYYNNYQPGGYARQMSNVGVPVPGCQSGLMNQANSPSGSDNSGQQMSRNEKEQHPAGPTTVVTQSPSDPKAAQTISSQSSNIQQSVVQQASVPVPLQPMIYGSAYHNPYGFRAADNMNSAAFPSNMNNLRMVPSELHFVDPSQLAGRQAITVQGKPETELTYNPQDMVNAYGAGNFQPPIFGLWKRQTPAYRGLQSGYQYAYPPIDSRFLGTAAQQLPQRRIEHPLPSLRQSSPVDHTNQPLPPNMYGARKWEPVTNLNFETPFNLGTFENPAYSGQGPSGFSMQGPRSSASTPLCRDKRQSDQSWMYPYASWSMYDNQMGQERAAAIPGSLPSPLTPYHGPFAPLSEIFPTGQPLLAPGQNYIPGYANAHAKGAAEGIQRFVTGITQMVPMFTGSNPLYR